MREFVDEQIIPVATELEHRDEYPTEIVEGMKEMGLFGLMIPEEYGGLGESLLTYALVVEEIARGWMSVSGIINTHFIVAYCCSSTAPRSRSSATCRGWRPARCAGRSRCPSRAAARTSPRSRPRRCATGGSTTGRITGQKMWLTNGGSANLVAVLIKTDAEAAEGAPSTRR